jgi:23S rRNA (cytosine1962-C5)-methyltransferase
MTQDEPVSPANLAYALLDVGDARRLERFGAIIIDRPAPGAEGHVPQDPAAWASADARFDRAERDAVAHEGWTTRDGQPLEPWLVAEGDLQFELRLAPSGQVGLFPEQVPERAWIRRQANRIGELSTARADRAAGDDPFSGSTAVLNLFGYSGATTITAARPGIAVTHVDASRPAVAWARHNAGLNGLAAAPIRWISDDAAAFAERELRRGRRYAGIILDPPSYGHGATGKAWRLADDLPALLAACAELLDDGPAFIMLTAHTPGFGPDRLGETLLEALEPVVGSGAGAAIEVADQSLLSDRGTRLHLGSMARWAR